MEIGNAPPTCGIPISQRPHPHLRKIAGAFVTLPDLKTVSFTQKRNKSE
jgi:hypothetical protein